jgi:hypothetical protein
VDSAARQPRRPRRVTLLLGVAAFVIAADVISKAIVVARMATRRSACSAGFSPSP